MTDIQKAVETQLRNIQARTGKSLDELYEFIRGSGLAKHGEMVAHLKAELGLGHGDANTLVHAAKQAGTPPTTPGGDPLDALYTGPKAPLRPIHEALLAKMKPLGGFEEAPKQKYVSYRRKKQFAMIGPPANTRVELGLNIKDLPESPRLEKLPAGQMCNYRVKLTDASQVDAEIAGWIKRAYEAAG
jgi:predicted transport protein